MELEFFTTLILLNIAIYCEVSPFGSKNLCAAMLWNQELYEALQIRVLLNPF